MTYAPCELCEGKGKIRGNEMCPNCDGFGIWDYVADDNEAAVRFLKDSEATDVSDHAKIICWERIHSLPPDNIEQMLRVLDKPTKESFDELHKAGSQKWGWGWLHANRFAIALCRLNGIDPKKHAYGITKVSWYWLERENQEKIEAPWVTENSSKKIDVAIDKEQ